MIIKVQCMFKFGLTYTHEFPIYGDLILDPYVHIKSTLHRATKPLPNTDLVCGLGMLVVSFLLITRQIL